MITAERDPQTAMICRYYDGCTAGDLDILNATLHPDVVHYFLAPNIGSSAVGPRAHLAHYWRKVTRMLDARWVVDRAVTCGTETVIEWTMFWRPQPGAERIATRGAEWFVFEDGLIREIRSYYQQKPFTTELDGFDYAARGYSMLHAESSSLHPESIHFASPGDTA